MEYLLAALAALAVGVAVWLGMSRAGLRARHGAAMDARVRAELRAEELERRVETLQRIEGDLKAQNVQLAAQAETERALFEERRQALHAAQEQVERELRERIAELNKKFEETFQSLAAEALRSSREDFFKLAQETFKAEREKSVAEVERRKMAVDELIRPIGETLKKTDEKLAAMETARTESFATISEQLRASAEASGTLRSETAKLVRALREPHVRGRYGEIQLKRVAELAGMQAYCDFSEQASARDGDGQLQRPDMVVRLPNERCVIVDAKCNIAAYLDAIEAPTPEEADGHLDRFARHVSDQASSLAKKKYWALTDYDGSPEFVVMFIPGDQFVDAALSRQPEILESAARQGVILASPSTLIGLLRAVAVGYKEQRLAKEAAELRELGVQLHERAATAFEYVSRLGKALEMAVTRYNEFVGSYQTRFEPTLRRFEGAGVRSGKELAGIEELAVRPRGVQPALEAAGAVGNGEAAHELDGAA